MSTNNEDKLILGVMNLLPVLFWDLENFLWIW